MTTGDATHLRFARAMSLEKDLQLAALRREVEVQGAYPADLPEIGDVPPEGYPAIGRVGMGTVVLARDGTVWPWPWMDPEKHPGIPEADWKARVGDLMVAP
ncbi:MAG: hypothetical protein ACOYOQ_00170 [Microthrixaceae bacterium]